MADQRTLRVVIVGNASQAQSALQNLGDDADRLEQRTGRFSGALQGMGGRLAAFGATAAAGVAVAAGAVAVGAFKAAADAETIQVAFKTLTGSSDKAKAHMEDLQKFAANSPFDFKGLAAASVKLQGVGVKAKEVIPHLTAWGNAASAMGVSGESFENVLGALSQALGNGRLGLEDFNQMADNGLPVIGLLADAMGISQAKVRELATAGKLATDKVMPLLEGVMNKKFGTAMADQSKTANGQLSSLADNWDQLLTKIGTPLLPIAKAAIGGISTLIGNIGTYLAPVMKLFRGVGESIRSSFGGQSSGKVSELQAKLSGIWSVVGPALSQFVAFFKGTLMPLFADLWAKAQPVLQKLWQTFMVYLEAIKVAIQVFVTGVQIFWGIFGEFIINTLKTVFSILMQVVGGALDIIMGIYNVFIGIFTGNWSKAWKGITQIFSGVWNIIKGVLRLALAAIKAPFQIAIAWFRGTWGRLWSWMVSALAEKWKSISKSIGDMPGKIRAFFTKLPGDLKRIGLNIITGLVNGIQNGYEAVKRAVAGLIDKIPGPIKKALGIHSPSRVMAEIGKWITEGLVKGMLGGTKKVEATSKKLHELVTKAFKAGKISKGKASDLHKWLHKEDTKLWKLAKSREKIAAALKKANDKLAGLKKAKADMASGIADKAKDFGSVMGVFDSSEFGDNSANALLARLKGKLAAIVGFRKNLGMLAKRGLGAGIINEIAQAGPEAGGAMAQSLLNADSGQIKQLNSTYSAIGKQSKNLGSMVSNDYYNAGIKSAEGLVKGLKSKESKLTKAITDLAKSMVKALKKALGIKSPSRVFKALGGFTAAGFTAGLIGGHGDVQKAVNDLAGTRPTGRLANRSIARETALQGAAGGNAAPTVYVTVQGNVTAEKALARAIASTVRDEIVRTGKRNGGRTGF
ncbi:tape measure protein [Streptomyces sp. NBC_01751]|uniref:tape measure protein n=1 Tax=Streptomyces sp. NBC_01751 TaxID=2975929 RepID=UPI002DD9D357|nr:tape measure protein [Streptomyces sp. NBC_01751]WSD23381.1 tape measure protein [Streptomyces sp. NBC_01751]